MKSRKAVQEVWKFTLFTSASIQGALLEKWVYGFGQRQFTETVTIFGIFTLILYARKNQGHI